MKVCFTKKIKLFIIIALVVLVGGVAMVGGLGFNQSVDMRPSYEMQVSVNQNAGDSVNVLKSATAKAFAENGLTPVAYSVQVGNDGALVIYKFNSDVSSKKDAVKTVIDSELKNASVAGLESEVKVYSLSVNNLYGQVWGVVGALAICLAIIFVYAIFVAGVKGSLAIICSALLSTLVALAFVGLVRLPVGPFLAIFASVAFLISAITSTVMASKYKTLIKNATNSISSVEVVEKVEKTGKNAFVATAVAIAIASVCIMAFNFMATLFLGLGVLASGLIGLITAVCLTPFVYTALNK